jgi:hypothetical protein
MRNVRVTTDRCVDFHSVKDVARCVILPGMTSEEKAIACWRVIAENLYQYPWVYDVPQRAHEWHDAIKSLNVYGHGLCGSQARVLGALWQEVFGYENTRLTGIREAKPGSWQMGHNPGAFIFGTMQKGFDLRKKQGHTTIEVFYDDHWHHLDPMVQYYAYTRDGSRIASLEETIADPCLVTNPNREIGGLMPDGDISRVFYASEPADWEPGPGYFIVRDTVMDVDLEAGQSITWFWDKLEGRFYFPSIWRERFSQPYFDNGPRHPNETLAKWRHYGNGLFVTRKERLDLPTRLHLRLPYTFVGGSMGCHFSGSTGYYYMHCPYSEMGTMRGGIRSGENVLNIDDLVMGDHEALMIFNGSGVLENVETRLVFQHHFQVRPRLLEGANLVSVSGEFEGNEQLEMVWKWNEAGGQHRESRHILRPPADVQVNVGELDIEPDGNPKYMHSLSLSCGSG